MTLISIKNKKNIFIIGVVIFGIILGILWHLNKNKEINLSYPPECFDNFDCSIQMKCENNVCVSVGCVEQGGAIPGAISPKNREHMATECCDGLKRIAYFGNFDKNCNSVFLAGGPAAICSYCGNGNCEKWESKCNCPDDCGK